MGICKILFLVTGIITSCNNPSGEKSKDFDAFWNNTVQELGDDIYFEEKKDSIVDDKKWKLYRIKSFKDIYFYAWVSEPLNSGKFPINIRFQGFGKGGTNINEPPHQWFLKQKNFINMVIDIRGQGLSTEQIEFKEYLINGLSNKEDYIYRGAYMDAVKAVDFISQNPKSDGNIIVSGGSQGGALSVAAAALNPKVTMCIIGFPFLTDIDNYDKSLWPMNIFIHYAMKSDIDLFELNNTLSYFDILNFSDKINVPVFIRSQEKDDITPLEGAVNFFNNLKTDKKEMYIEPCEGHGCSSNSEKANTLENLFIKKNMVHD